MKKESSNKTKYKSAEDFHESPTGLWFRNFFNYKDYLREQPKYINLSRVFPLTYFIDMIKKSSLTLVKPQLWSDRLENHFLHQIY